MSVFVHDILDFPFSHLHLKTCINKCSTTETKQVQSSRFKIHFTSTFTLKFPSEMILCLESITDNISDFIKSIELLIYG